MSGPIGLKEVLNLQKLVKQEHIKHKNISIQSSKYVTVNEGNGIKVFITGTSAVTPLPTVVDAALMNPVSKIIAFRVQKQISVYYMETKDTKQTNMQATIHYWKWVDAKTLAIVTSESVYHWSLDGNSKPQKIFDRDSNGVVQILNYSCSKGGDWVMLNGVTKTQTGLEGVLQLYSRKRKENKPTKSMAACFASVKLEGNDAPSTLFCYIQDGKLKALEIETKGFATAMDIQFDGKDFPIAMVPDNKHGIVFVVTTAGWLYVYEVQTGLCILRNKCTNAKMWHCIEHEDGGVMTVDSAGKVCHFFVNEENIVAYVCKTFDFGKGLELAKLYGYPGPEDLFVQQFQQLLQQGKTNDAIAFAASTKTLRTLQTMKYLSTCPAVQVQGRQVAALGYYFALLIQKGKLNEQESIQFLNYCIAKGSLQKIKALYDTGKLTPSVELGNLVNKINNLELAVRIFEDSGSPKMVIRCYLTMGYQAQSSEEAYPLFEKIIKYSEASNFKPNYSSLISQLVKLNPERAADFGVLLVNHPNGSILSIEEILKPFKMRNDVLNLTNILVKYLDKRGDREEDADLQTELLRVNIRSMPRVARAIMDNEQYNFTHYNKVQIAGLCEAQGLYDKALEHYDDMKDYKRVLRHAPKINPDYILNWFMNLQEEEFLECIGFLLGENLKENLRLVIVLCQKQEGIEEKKLIGLFQKHKSHAGLFYYLGSKMNKCEDPEVVFTYLKAAVKCKQFQQVLHICKDHKHYDPVQVRDFLMEANLQDPVPLIHVCDRFDFVEELTEHLYTNQLFKFISAYVHRVSTEKAPKVIGKLLDLHANEDELHELIENLLPPPNEDFIKNLVEEVEKRNRLSILRYWLEARERDGLEDVHLYNGLAKIYVEIDYNPKEYLKNNTKYDRKVVGAFCEKVDPNLSFICYERADGECDHELFDLCNKHGLFEQLAGYLVKKKDIDLWFHCLQNDTKERRALIDQVVATALPETKSDDELKITVKGFLKAELKQELIEILEKVVLHGDENSSFRTNTILQHVLIITGMQVAKERVMDYVTRLQHYKVEIAEHCIKYECFEEAFYIYKRFEEFDKAITILLDNIVDMKRAADFAEIQDDKKVYSILAAAQLKNGLVKESIASFLKAEDSSLYEEVLIAGSQAELYEELIEFIVMVRKEVQDAIVDNELIYCYAKIEQYAQLQEFLPTPHAAKLEKVAVRIFDEKMYKAARILFSYTNNFSKLAECHILLGDYKDAYEAALKAKSVQTWKLVCFACVAAKEFKLAEKAGLNVVGSAEHLKELIAEYEKYCYFEQLISMLESGIVDNKGRGLYTAVGVLYSKYKPQKLMEHIKNYGSRLNVVTVLRACKENYQWKEAVLLNKQSKQHERALRIILAQNECWTAQGFVDVIINVTRTELFYTSIKYYLDEHPMQLTPLLIELSQKLDHTRVVQIVKQAGQLSLVKGYLEHVQGCNKPAVNEALNGLYLEEENYTQLRVSIDSYREFDQLGLAVKIRSHELLELRRIAAYLYKLNQRYDTSLELSKKDMVWADCMETVYSSKDPKLAENLLRYFIEKKQKACFSACLYICFDLIEADVVLELSWRFGLFDFSMPFMIQSFFNFSKRIATLERKVEAGIKPEEKQENEESADPLMLQSSRLMITQGQQMGMQQPNMGMNPNMGMQQPNMGMNPNMGFNPNQNMGFNPNPNPQFQM